MEGTAVFECSACAGAALVLYASGIEMRGLVFKGLTLIGGTQEVEATLVNTNVSESKRSHYEASTVACSAATCYLIDLQAGLDITGTARMVIHLESCFVEDNEGSGILFNVPGGQLNLVNPEPSTPNFKP